MCVIVCDIIQSLRAANALPASAQHLNTRTNSAFAFAPVLPAMALRCTVADCINC